MKKRRKANKKGEVTHKEIIYRPIGIVHTPFEGIDGTPNQPTVGKDVKGMIEIEPEYVACLRPRENNVCICVS